MLNNMNAHHKFFSSDISELYDRNRCKFEIYFPQLDVRIYFIYLEDILSIFKLRAIWYNLHANLNSSKHKKSFSEAWYEENHCIFACLALKLSISTQTVGNIIVDGLMKYYKGTQQEYIISIILHWQTY